MDQGSGTAIKASSVGREFSKTKLEQRIGTFVALAVTQMPSTERNEARSNRPPRPLAASPDLYRQYLDARRATDQTRKMELAALWDKQRERMRAVSEAGKVTFPAAAGRFSNRAQRKQVRDTVKAGIARIRRAMAKFNGQALMFNGSDGLRAKCVEVAAREGLGLTFADPGMERERQQQVLSKDNHVSISGMAPDRRKKSDERDRCDPHHESMEQQRQGMTR